MTVSVFTGDNVGLLVDKMVGRALTPPLADPFAPEWIIVNSRGMESWLRRRITGITGISANLQMPFLQSFIDATCLRMPCNPGVDDDSDRSYGEKTIVRRCPHDSTKPVDNDGLFSKSVLLWRIYDALGEASLWGAEIVSYLDGRDDPELRRYQLAARLATLYDRYQVYRPELLDLWENGRDDDWQARLWRKLRSECAAPSRSERIRSVIRRIDDLMLGHCDAGGAVTRLSVFGVSSLAPLHLDFFIALSGRIPVSFFLFLPAGEKSVRHPLRHWSELGGEFLDSLRARGAVVTTHLRSTEKSAAVLARLRGHIRADQPAPGTDERERPVPSDKSLLLHSCHSRRRETEVIHDQLLSFFEEDPELSPHDVIVMAPDISEYTPHIETVFSGAPGTASIPYSISDRVGIESSLVFSTVVELLKLRRSRFRATELLDLLSVPVVAESFGIGDRDLTRLSDWVSRVGIFWGLDAGQRRELLGEASPEGTWAPDAGQRRELPGEASPEGTWALGIDRLLAGYAIGPDFENPVSGMFGDISPFPHIEGDSARLLGRLAEFMFRLKQLAAELCRDRSVPYWCKWIQQVLLDGFFSAATAETAVELQKIRNALAGISDCALAARYTEPVSVDIMAEHLERVMSETFAGSPFFRGRVTFCSMLPMRSIPARVICVMGMDDGLFPRSDRHLGFDRSAGQRRPGDRSRRIDDRYLFLEALFAAGEKFCISYVGRSRLDNTRQAPSVMVSELFECLERYFDLPASSKSTYDSTVLRFNETEHRLAPFNVEYFTGEDPGLFTYSSKDAAAARSALSPSPSRPLFRASPLPPVSCDELSLLKLSPDRLTDFLFDPAAYLLEQRLGVRTRRYTRGPVRDNELEMNYLERYRNRQRIFRAVVRGDEPSDCLKWLIGSGLWGSGARQRALFHDEWTRAQYYLENTLLPMSGGSKNLLSVLNMQGLEAAVDYRPSRGDISAYSVSGFISPVFDGDVVICHYAGSNYRKRLRALVGRICIDACGTADADSSPGSAGRTILASLGRKAVADVFVYKTPEKAGAASAELDYLIELYKNGLRRPLPFSMDDFSDFIKMSSRSAPSGKPPGENAGYLQMALGQNAPWDDPLFVEIARHLQGTFQAWEVRQ